MSTRSLPKLRTSSVSTTNSSLSSMSTLPLSPNATPFTPQRLSEALTESNETPNSAVSVVVGAPIIGARPSMPGACLYHTCEDLRNRLSTIHTLSSSLEAALQPRSEFDKPVWISRTNASSVSVASSSVSGATQALKNLTLDESHKKSEDDTTTDTDGNDSHGINNNNPQASQSSIASTQANSLPVSFVDPVTQIWRFFKQGSSLCALFNLTSPKTLLTTNIQLHDIRASKRAVYDFVQGCKAELGYQDHELFTISNVFSDNTADLIKVLKTVGLLIRTLESRNILPSPSSSHLSLDSFCLREKRDRVMQEILTTERKYVQDLEVLVQFQEQLQTSGIVSLDTIHYLFPNLLQLIDFQRRFLIGVELHASFSPREQRLGYLILSLEEGFEVYEGYALNQKSACDLAYAELPKIQQVTGIIDPAVELQGLLLKPIQRICQYPMLLRQLIKSTPPDWAYYDELREGLDALLRITTSVNETQRRVQNVDVVKDLNDRVRDWRGHKVEEFGDLLHDGVFAVITPGLERDYHLYLFENIILFCKDAPQAKKPIIKKNKLQSAKRNSIVLKGRIYMAYITHVSTVTQDGYFMHIAWASRDASDTGSFDVRFRHEEALAQWESTIRRMVARYHNPMFNSLNPSAIDFANDTDSDDGAAANDTQGASAVAANSENNVNPGKANTNGALHNLGLSTASLSLDSSRPATPVESPRTMSTSSTASLPIFNVQHQTYSAATNMAGKNPDYTRSLNDFPAPPNGLMSSHAASNSLQYNSASYNMKSVGLPLRARSASSPSFASGAASGGFHTSSVPPPMPDLQEATIQAGEEPSSRPESGQHIKIRLFYLEDSFLLIVPYTIKYHELLERAERKIRLCGKQTPNPLRLKYKDEDNDFVLINSEEDLQMALEQRQESDDKLNDRLSIWAV